MISKSCIRHTRLSVNAQDGASLVEIMVALVLSLILMAGVGQIYLGSKQTYRLQDGQARLQENARYALEMLSRDIRRTGGMGRQSTGSFIPPTPQQLTQWNTNQVPSVSPIILANAPLGLVVPDNPKNATNLPSGVVRGPAVSGGDNATGSTTGSFSNPNPSLSNALNNVVVKGTDAITVQFAESCGIVTTAAQSTVNGIIATLPASNNPCGTTSPGPLLISNWEKAHIFRSDGNNTGDIGYTYAVGAEIMRFRAYTYYIRLNLAGEPSLYRYDNTVNNSDELAEGVEDMQLIYGVDSNNDGTADEYVSAVGVANWAQVVSVRITLTLRSVGFNADNLASKPNPTRVFNGANLVDGRLVKNFSISIWLRR